MLALWACSPARGRCPTGATPHGAAPPAGTLEFCEESPGVRTGRFVEWYPEITPSQKKREGSYVHGKLDGKWLAYFPDGKLEREESYQAGTLEGHAVEYYPSGVKKEEGTLEHGVRVGTWTTFHENGARWKATRLRSRLNSLTSAPGVKLFPSNS
jgi:hypothetical protein